MESDYVKLKDVKPVLAGYIRDAQSLVNMTPLPDDKAIHDIRVLMKKSRAVVKLIKTQIDVEAFSREYESYRETGRLLSTWRDTTVFRKTLKDLKKSHPSLFSKLSGDPVLSRLVAKPENQTEPSSSQKEDIEKIKDTLGKAGYRLRFCDLSRIDPQSLLNELNDTHRIVTEKYLASRNYMKPEMIHEFRKKAKDFLYQLYFFRPLNPHSIKTLEKKLDLMTLNLGKCNDLSQLINELGYKYKPGSDITPIDELVVLIRHEQDRYLSKVWPVAYKIFCPGQKLLNVLGFKLLMI